MNKIEFNNSWIEFNNKYKNLLDPNERRAFCLIKKIWTGLSSFVDKTWRYSSIYLSIRVHFTSLCGELQNKHFGFFFSWIKGMQNKSNSVSSFLTAVPIWITAVTVFVRSSFDETSRNVSIFPSRSVLYY